MWLVLYNFWNLFVILCSNYNTQALSSVELVVVEALEIAANECLAMLVSVCLCLSTCVYMPVLVSACMFVYVCVCVCVHVYAFYHTIIHNLVHIIIHVIYRRMTLTWKAKWRMYTINLRRCVCVCVCVCHARVHVCAYYKLYSNHFYHKLPYSTKLWQITVQNILAERNIGGVVALHSKSAEMKTIGR